MHTPQTVPSRTTSIQVLGRMMSLIDALAKAREPVSLKLLSASTGLHPSTAHRILNDLVAGRFVDRPEPGRYRLGMRLLELGNVVRSRIPVRDAALGPMRALHRSTGQTVNLSVRQGDEIVDVERACDAFAGMRDARAGASRAPLHLTSAGKLFLAIEEPRQLRSYALRTGLVGRTRNSITELERLESELRQVRTRGWSRDDEELEVGVRGIAAAIRDDDGRLVAGLSLAAPADRLRDAWIDDLTDTAERISAAIAAG